MSKPSLSESTLHIKTSCKTKSNILVELKAKVQNLQVVRNKLTAVKAKHIGVFHQIDTYFHVPKGRLKLREIEGAEKAQLVYYERMNVAGPRKSVVFIIEIQEPKHFKTLLHKILKIRATVEKTREIYRYKGTQIHLDVVQQLGTFIEFERPVSPTAQAIERGRRMLERLMDTFEVRLENLEKRSYGDLVQTP